MTGPIETGQGAAAARGIDVVRTYLEMREPGQLRGRPLDARGAELARLRPCTVAEYRALYAEVGAAYHWRDRDAWTDEQLARYLERPDVQVWRLTVDGATAGYFELAEHPDDRSVELVYFGLVRDFHGRGLGAALLTAAATEAWRGTPSRVWLHTCTLDAPAALPNYLARGFAVVREERYVELSAD
jgi:ribosomal protein S18 acetylase RimI-like enzyme